MTQQHDEEVVSAVSTAPAKSVDLSLVLSIFFIGISLGAMIPVGMKYFGHWKHAAPASEPAAHQGEGKTEAKTEAKLEAASAVATAEVAPGPKEAVQYGPKSEPAKKTVAVAKNETVIRSKGEVKSVMAESVDRPRAAARPTAQTAAIAKDKAVKQVQELEKKSKRNKVAMIGPDAPILEEVADGPTAREIQDLTLAYTQKKKTETATAMPVNLPAGAAPAPVVAMNPPAPAVSEAPAASPEAPAKTSATQAPKVFALSVNNANYSKDTLAKCVKRCLLLGIDAFGMPIKAIISGPAYAKALMNHEGSINLSGQPRLIKNQQVLIVENITFNLQPSMALKANKLRAEGSPSALKNTSYTPIKTQGNDPRPGTVVRTSPGAAEEE